MRSRWPICGGLAALLALSCSNLEADLCSYDLACEASSECPGSATCVEGRCMPEGEVCAPFAGAQTTDGAGGRPCGRGAPARGLGKKDEVTLSITT